MKVYGKIHNLMKKDRCISIVIDNHLSFFHLSHRYMKDFKNYLSKKPYVFLDVNNNSQIINGYRCHEVEHFIKIILPKRKKSDIFYDLNLIQQGVKSIINRPQNRLFIDLEFSLISPLTYGVSEIVQYGFVLEDENGKIILEDASLVKPTLKASLNVKTLLFLSKGLDDFKHACNYIEFYQLLESIINKYDPKIIAWGRNDILAMENSFKLNHLLPLDVRNRYMNLMQVVKNYYNYKQEMGLFATYSEFTHRPIDEQMHDALEDAMIAREIFHLFKSKINNE